MRNLSFSPGQIVYVNNFIQSNKIKDYFFKLSHQYVTARILKSIGNVAFELLNPISKKTIGIYHVKDIKS